MPRDYPQHWEADVVLADGGVVHLRPIRADDTEALRAMHSGMSQRSLYLRYFAAIDQISDAVLTMFTGVDHESSVGLAAELAGEIIAAGTYHRDGSSPRAEVAFAVRDDHQGRGIGSILLEHLAAAAQENGITTFTAEVLAENQQMVRVFADAGYQVTRSYSSGVIDLGFDIAPTDASREVLLARENRAEARSISRLLAPRSIAVIGASEDPSKLGHALLSNLIGGGFTGRLYPVNRDARTLLGLTSYADVTAIPDPVDVAVVAVPAATVAEVVRGCREKGVHGLIVLTDGLRLDPGEHPAGDHRAVDGDGSPMSQRQLVALARANGMRVLGPNCLGLVNTDPEIRMNATLAPVVPPAGRVGFFCQSGALGIAILADAAARGLGLSSFVSAGNRADVSGNDLLQFWQTDERTDVVLLSLESFGNPRKFARLARALARTKPVIAVKSGRHAVLPAGLAAASVALPPAVVDTIFTQAGVIRTDTLAQAFDVAQVLATQPTPRSDVVAVVGNSTALGILAIDACLDAGLRPAAGAPVDLGVNAGPGELAGAVRAAAADPAVGAVVVVFVPPLAIDGRSHASALRDAAAELEIPVVSTFLAVDGLVDALTVPGPDGGAARGSVPSFGTPDRAVAALAAALRYAQFTGGPAGVLIRPDGIDSVRARSAVDGWRSAADGIRDLTDDELVVLLGAYGITVQPFAVAESEDGALAAADRLGYPVVLKAYDPINRESLAGGGVVSSLMTQQQVAAAYQVLSESAGSAVYVQRMAPSRGSVATVFGISSDPSFGALVSFGIGGVTTDLLNDKGYRAVPLTDTDAAALIAAPQAAPLLDGYRGRPVVDRAPLEDLALRLSALADDLPEILALDVRALATDDGVAVIGMAGMIGPPGVRPDGRRRMR